MDILTVTCKDDIEYFLLQIISIKKYLQGNYKHFVIINDLPRYTTKKWRNRWWKLIRNVYEHSIPFEIIVPDLNINRSMNGWKTQQIYKFYYYQYINQDYLILDSKNFFIRTCSIDEFKTMLGSGELRNIDFLFEEVNKKYAEHFETEPLKQVFSWITPFVANYEILKNYGSPEKIANTLLTCKNNSSDAWPSEFVWYTYLTTNHLHSLKQPIKSKIIWEITPQLPRVLKKILEDKNIKISGIHRRVISELTTLEDKEKLIEFLSSFKLPYTFTNIIDN